jgi:hypothetical protein
MMDTKLTVFYAAAITIVAVVVVTLALAGLYILGFKDGRLHEICKAAGGVLAVDQCVQPVEIKK